MKGILCILAIVLLCGCLFSQTAPEWEWVTSGGGLQQDYGSRIAIDESGNSFVIGSFEGTATWGSTTLTSNGGSDIFVAKLDNSGNWLWALKIGGINLDRDLDIASDNNGNVYFTGLVWGTISLGDSTFVTNSTESIVAMLDTDGNCLWLNHTPHISAFSLAIDSSGNSFICGSFQGTASFGGTVLESSGYQNLFLAKLDSSGNWLWANSAVSMGSVLAIDIAFDNNCNCFITGYYNDDVTFGQTTINSIGDFDLFVAKADSNGTWLWSQQAGGLYDDLVRSITTDLMGNSYITGYFTATVNFGQITLIAESNCDVFIAKISSDGNWLWVNQAGENDYNAGECISIDNSCNIYIAGIFMSGITFGETQLSSSGSYDVFVTKLDSNGNWLWAIKAGGTGLDWGYGIITDNNGYCYMSGGFNNTADFGMHSLTSTGNSDAFVAKLSSDGTFNDDDLIQENTSLSHLFTAYPNPLHRGSESIIKAEIEPSETGSITIYNLKGQVVESYSLGSGSHSITFTGKDLAAGIYFYRLHTHSVNEVKKLILLKE